MENKKSLIGYLEKIKNPYEKFIWCINAKSTIIHNVNCDTSNKDIAKTFMFRSSLQDILSNKKAVEILSDVVIIDEPTQINNDIFIFIKCDNYNEKKRQLKLLGIK